MKSAVASGQFCRNFHKVRTRMLKYPKAEKPGNKCADKQIDDKACNHRKAASSKGKAVARSCCRSRSLLSTSACAIADVPPNANAFHLHFIIRGRI